ncbi:MAG: N-acetylglucosamine kinase [Sphingobacteriaceae bacterium]
MIIIADGGSTKTSWCLVNEEKERTYFHTEGYNPYFSSTEYIINSLNNSLPADLDRAAIKELYYYGAGCSTDEKVAIVVKAMESVFTSANVYVSHDLLASARALLGITPGFAGILGTGTNSCLYDGRKITHNVDSLGYFLGDEGSGSFIGKRLLRDYMRGLMPGDLQDIFFKTYQLSHADIFEHLYHKPLPNRFCASFSKFIDDNRQEAAYTREVVGEAFTAFFKNIVSHYPNYQQYSLNCVGSVAFNFKDVLAEVAAQYGMQVGKIIRAPIDDLVNYHLELAPKA